MATDFPDIELPYAKTKPAAVPPASTSPTPTAQATTAPLTDFPDINLPWAKPVQEEPAPPRKIDTGSTTLNYGLGVLAGTGRALPNMIGATPHLAASLIGMGDKVPDFSSSITPDFLNVSADPDNPLVRMGEDIAGGALLPGGFLGAGRLASMAGLGKLGPALAKAGLFMGAGKLGSAGDVATGAERLLPAITQSARTMGAAGLGGALAGNVAAGAGLGETGQAWSGLLGGAGLAHTPRVGNFGASGMAADLRDRVNARADIALLKANASDPSVIDSIGTGQIPVQPGQRITDLTGPGSTPGNPKPLDTKLNRNYLQLSSEDPGKYGISDVTVPNESGASERTPALGLGRNLSNVTRQDALQGEITQETPGTATPSTDLTGALQTHAANISGAADNLLPATPNLATAGNQVRGAMANLVEGARGKLNADYALLKTMAPDAEAKVNNAAQEVDKAAAEAQAPGTRSGQPISPLSSAAQALIADIPAAGEFVPLQTMRLLKSRLADMIGIANRDGDTGTVRVLSPIAKGLDADIYSAPTEGRNMSPEAAQHLQDTNNRYRQFMTAMDGSGVSDVLQGTGRFDEAGKPIYSVPDGNVMDKLWQQGPSGNTNMENFSNLLSQSPEHAPAAWGAMLQGISTHMNEAPSATKWMNAHSAALETLPPVVREKLAVKAGVQEHLATLKPWLDGTKTPEALTESMIKNGKTDEAQALSRATAGNPEAHAALQRLARQHAAKQIDLTSGIDSAKKLHKVADSGVMQHLGVGADELKQWKQHADAMHHMGTTEKEAMGTVVGGGSPTGRNLSMKDAIAAKVAGTQGLRGHARRILPILGLHHPWIGSALEYFMGPQDARSAAEPYARAHAYLDDASRIRGLYKTAGHLPRLGGLAQYAGRVALPGTAGGQQTRQIRRRISEASAGY